MENKSKKALLSVVLVILMQFMSFLYSLIVKKVYLGIFSISLYGVIGVFQSFFSSLLMMEMGFGTILIYNLFDPVSKNDNSAIKTQLSIFKTIYAILSLIIVIISLLFAPFIYDAFNIDFDNKPIVYLIYILNIITIVVKYKFLCKKSILDAGENKYISILITVFVDMILFLLKMVSLLELNSLVLFCIATLVQPIIVTLIEVLWVDKHYYFGKVKYAKFKEIKNSGVLKQCKKYIYATIYNLVFFSMDNIIISMLLSTDHVAFTSNYTSLISTGYSLIVSAMGSLRGIMASYVCQEGQKKLYEVFCKIRTLDFLLTSIIVVGFYVMIDKFIILWIGNDYLLDKRITIVLLFTLLLNGLFEIVSNIFVINGYIFREKYPLIISAFTNFLLTIVLIRDFGVFGAFFATFVATIVFWIGKFYYIFTDVFAKYKFEIIKYYCLCIILVISESLIIDKICNMIFKNVNSLVVFLAECLFIAILVISMNILFAFIYKKMTFGRNNKFIL